ncbi:MAG: helix-turn-helix domain-containing protein [Gammaproteobacteria bacterium]|nr:helix-turn-helix domain-containing protein [Gammaproteobacteria bacterium]
MIEQLFNKLELSEKEAVAYLALLEHGSMTVRELTKRTGIPRTSLYGHLNALFKQGFVRRMGYGDETYQWEAESPVVLKQAAEDRVASWQKQSADLDELLPSLLSKRKTDYLKPKLIYLESIDDIKNAMNEVLLYQNTKTQTFWPITEMLKMVGVDFLYNHNVLRIKNNVEIQAIWPITHDDIFKEHPYLGVGEAFKREIRQPPEGVMSSLGYWAYQNKVLFISSTRENFGFIVESAELRQMLKTQFDYLWQISKPILVDPQDTAPFIDAHFS